MKTCLSVALACLALGGCASYTEFEAAGMTGGQNLASSPDKLEKVQVFGKPYTPEKKVQELALYKCAEVAKSKGKPYFLLYNGLFNAAAKRPSAQPAVANVDSYAMVTAFVLLLDAPRQGALETQAILDGLAGSDAAALKK